MDYTIQCNTIQPLKALPRLEKVGRSKKEEERKGKIVSDKRSGVTIIIV